MSDKTYFESLNKKELEAACEAFGENPEGNKSQLSARLVEAGVTEKEHREMFGLEPAPKPEPVAPRAATKEEVVTQQESLPAVKNHLVKMERDNPLFEFGGYKFTQSHPYALMTGSDAERLMRSEQGFRLALPSELEEFYK